MYRRIKNLCGRHNLRPVGSQCVILAAGSLLGLVCSGARQSKTPLLWRPCVELRGRFALAELVLRLVGLGWSEEVGGGYTTRFEGMCLCTCDGGCFVKDASRHETSASQSNVFRAVAARDELQLRWSRLRPTLTESRRMVGHTADKPRPTVVPSSPASVASEYASSHLSTGIAGNGSDCRLAPAPTCSTAAAAPV